MRAGTNWLLLIMVAATISPFTESERFPDGPRRSVADVDLDRIRQERLRQGTFDDNRRGLEARLARGSG